jgi:hypothetical protein
MTRKQELLEIHREAAKHGLRLRRSEKILRVLQWEQAPKDHPELWTPEDISAMIRTVINNTTPQNNFGATLAIVHRYNREVDMLRATFGKETYDALVQVCRHLEWAASDPKVKKAPALVEWLDYMRVAIRRRPKSALEDSAALFREVAEAAESNQAGANAAVKYRAHRELVCAEYLRVEQQWASIAAAARWCAGALKAAADKDPARLRPRLSKAKEITTISGWLREAIDSDDRRYFEKLTPAAQKRLRKAT